MHIAACHLPWGHPRPWEGFLRVSRHGQGTRRHPPSPCSWPLERALCGKEEEYDWRTDHRRVLGCPQLAGHCARSHSLLLALLCVLQPSVAALFPYGTHHGCTRTIIPGIRYAVTQRSILPFTTTCLRAALPSPICCCLHPWVAHGTHQPDCWSCCSACSRPSLLLFSW